MIAMNCISSRDKAGVVAPGLFDSRVPVGQIMFLNICSNNS